MGVRACVRACVCVCFECNILLGRLKPVIEPSLLEEQCGFRPQRGTIDRIWVLRRSLRKP